MVRSGVVQKPTNRRDSRKVIGHASHQTGSKSLPGKQQPLGKISSKKSFKNTPFRNAVQTDALRGHDNQQLRFENRPNERSTTQVKYSADGHCFANCKPEEQLGQVYSQDHAKKTRNESYVIASNPTGYTDVTTKKGMVYDPNDVARMTVKETTENHYRIGGAHNDQGKGVVYDPADVARTTVKQTTEDHYRIGGIHNDQKKGQVYDPYDTAKTTIRQTTENQYHLGQIHNDQKKGQVYDPSDVARTTVKETTEKGDYLGMIGQGRKYKQIVYDPTDIARTTVKETTEKGDYLGVIGQGQKYKQIAYDPFDVAHTTHRETTENNDYLMPAESTALQNGTGYQTAPTDTKNTQRQFYCDFYHVKPAGQADAPSNPQSYESAYNMEQNAMKEVVAEGREPTLSSIKMGPGKTDVFIEIKKMERDQYNHYSSMRAPINCNQRKPMDVCELTSFKNALPAVNTYFDPAILKTYDNNPLAQSLHSWA